MRITIITCTIYKTSSLSLGVLLLLALPSWVLRTRELYPGQNRHIHAEHFGIDRCQAYVRFTSGNYLGIKNLCELSSLPHQGETL